jgi:hypothetical protein
MMMKPTTASPDSEAEYYVAYGDPVRAPAGSPLNEIARRANSCEMIFPRDIVERDLPGIRLIRGTDFLEEIRRALGASFQQSGVVLDTCHSGLACACEEMLGRFSFLHPITGVLTSSGTAAVDVNAFTDITKRIYDDFHAADRPVFDDRVSFVEGRDFAVSRNYWYEVRGEGSGWTVRGDAFLLRGPPDGVFEVDDIVPRPFWASTQDLRAGDELVITSDPAGIDCRYRVDERGSFDRTSAAGNCLRRTAFGASLRLQASLAFQPIAGRAAPALDAYWTCGPGDPQHRVGFNPSFVMPRRGSYGCTLHIVDRHGPMPFRASPAAEADPCRLDASYRDLAGNPQAEVNQVNLDFRARLDTDITVTVRVPEGQRLVEWSGDYRVNGQTPANPLVLRANDYIDLRYRCAAVEPRPPYPPPI